MMAYCTAQQLNPSSLWSTRLVLEESRNVEASTPVVDAHPERDRSSERCSWSEGVLTLEIRSGHQQFSGVDESSGEHHRLGQRCWSP